LVHCGGDEGVGGGVEVSAATEWPLRRLGEICEFKYGKSLPESARSGGAVPVYGSNGVVGGHDLPLTASETIVVGRKGSHGEVNFSDQPCWPIDTTYYVDSTATKANLHWLKYRLAGAGLNQMNRAAAVPGLNREDAYRVEVLLPPLEEQRRIAAILDQAETLRTQRRQALAHLDTLTQSLFLDMFGDPVANLKGWEKKPFGAVCETRLGKMLDAKQQTGANSRKYLRNANVQWFRIDTSDLLEMDFDSDARETFRLHSGDLLICEGGEPGRAAIWRGEVEGIYYQKALHRGRPKTDLVNAEYLVWLLWFLSKRGGLGDHVTAATIAHLTGEKLKVMAIPIPPLALQQTFATRIQAIEALKATHRTALAQLDALFASLQQQAFAGAL